MLDSDNNNAFLILAAGKGTRMKNDLPKVLHKICGKEMIRYVIDLAYNFKPERVATIVSPDAPETSGFLKKVYKDISLINQTERLGTGHAVKISLDFLKEVKGNVVCLYGDTPFISEQSITNLLETLDKNEKVAVAVLGFEPNDPAKYGRLKLDSDNNLVEIIEFSDANNDERNISLCNSGVVAIKGLHIQSLIEKIDNNNAKGEYYLTDIVKIAVDDGFVCKVVTANEDEVMGINSQNERAIAEKVTQENLRNKFLDNGVIITSPETVYFSSETEIDPGVEIEPFITFHGKVKVAKGSKIRSFSYLEDCTIGEENIIGPYARIRPNTELQKNVKIGNFVEIKKSNIGERSKVNHLTYIGDSEIGKDVNIGAGTITCNYDGKNKFTTEIGDRAFIGSNSSLVAPIKIGSNSVIGAGTTVLKDVKSNSIIINKKTQETV